jgi:hypothetical protein
LNKPAFLSAVPRSYDSCPSIVPADAGGSMACRVASKSGALSSGAEGTWFEVWWFPGVRRNSSVSFTFSIPV